MIHVYPLYTFTHGGDVPTQYPSYALYMPILTLSLSRSACVHMYCIYIMYVCIQLYRHHIIQSKYKIVQTDNSDIISTHVYIYIYIHTTCTIKSIHIDRSNIHKQIDSQIDPYRSIDTILIQSRSRQIDTIHIDGYHTPSPPKKRAGRCESALVHCFFNTVITC